MRRKSTKEKQKKLEKAEMEAEASTTAWYMSESNIRGPSKNQNKTTSNFLTVEEDFNHLTIHEGISDRD